MEISHQKAWRPEDRGTTVFTIKQTGQTLAGVISLACSGGFHIRNTEFFTL